MKIENKNTYLILFVVVVLALALFHVIYINTSNIYEETRILEKKTDELSGEVHKLGEDSKDTARKVDMLYCHFVEEAGDDC